MSNYTYSFTEKVRDLTWIITMLQEKAPSILSLFKMGVGALGKPCKAKHEWFDYPQKSVESALTGQANSGQKDVAVADGTLFAVGDNVIFKDQYYEECIVDSINVNTLTMVANLGYTHASATVLLKTSHPIEQGSSASGKTISQATLLTNYSEIFRYDVPVARSALGPTLNETMEDLLDYGVMQYMIKIYRDINNALLYGAPREATGSTISTRGRLGGLFYWFYTHASALKTDASAAAISTDLINELNRTIYNAGGSSCNSMVCSTKKGAQITKLNQAGTNQLIVIPQGSDILGIGPVTKFVGDIPGTAIKNVIIEPNLNDNTVFLLDSTKLFAPYHEKDGAPHDYDSGNNDFDGAQRTILAELTAEIQNPHNCHGCLYNLAS